MSLFISMYLSILTAVFMEKSFAAEPTKCRQCSCYELHLIDVQCRDYVIPCSCTGNGVDLAICHLDLSCTPTGPQALLEDVLDSCWSYTDALVRQGNCALFRSGSARRGILDVRDNVAQSIPDSSQYNSPIGVPPDPNNALPVFELTELTITMTKSFSSQRQSTTYLTTSPVLTYITSIMTISTEISTLLTVAATPAANSSTESPVIRVQPETVSGSKSKGLSKLGIGLGISLSFTTLGVAAYLMYYRLQNRRRKKVDLTTAADYDPVTGAEQVEEGNTKDQNAIVGENGFIGSENQTGEVAELHGDGVPQFPRELEGSHGSLLVELPGP
ncbi:hypothetical protein MMC22_004324 [Lobaria immixta]|nr:hypothetical protein [Lobaria immixta]